GPAAAGRGEERRRRPLRADRRGASLARGAAARLEEDPRGGEGGRRPRAPHPGADREPAARRSLPARRRDRLPAADGGVRAPAARGRAPGGEGPLDRKYHAATARAPGRGPAPPRPPPASPGPAPTPAR